MLPLYSIYPPPGAEQWHHIVIPPQFMRAVRAEHKGPSEKPMAHYMSYSFLRFHDYQDMPDMNSNNICSILGHLLYMILAALVYVPLLTNVDKCPKPSSQLSIRYCAYLHAIDYAHKNKYDGLVMLTDGYADTPNITKTMRCKILWVITDDDSYMHNKKWLSKIGKVTMISK